MRQLSAWLLILLAVSLSSAADPQAFELEGTVAIVLSGHQQTAPTVLRALQREVELLVDPSGIHVTWPSQSEAAHGSFQRLAMISLQGQCVANAKIPAVVRFNRKIVPLGQTHTVDGKVLPMADVKCDVIRKVIERELQGVSATERDGLFGRALGRVLAHELYHILLRTAVHGTEGLARPGQTSRDLLAVQTAFTQADERKLSVAFGSPNSAEFTSDTGR